jgi:hypothetical protein
MNRWLKRSLGTTDPLRIIKYTDINNLNYHNNSEVNTSILRFRFNNNNIISKDVNNIYFAFKQKRYNVRKKFNAKRKFQKSIDNIVSNISVNNDKIRLKVLIKNKFFNTISDKNATIGYKLIKKNKKHNDLVPVPLAKRILRTKRTLVLPAHINITVITNSYDVVHS